MSEWLADPDAGERLPHQLAEQCTVPEFQETADSPGRFTLGSCRQGGLLGL